ncbi:hypothetical protein BD410DRAFT_851601 [Rickenella mellea]|uniref:Uncharacterized protein n=1 Tax=Rickenella mellea TaxID=50990 RepID=A0A4Y7QCZ0_9AGAM|nr:hypothetical protein BD410DRAFT_851601 [Rickenella mellea]
MAEELGPRLTLCAVHIDPEKDEEFTFTFSLPPINSEKIEFVVGVEKHSFSFRLKSPPSSRIAEDLLGYLSRTETKGKTITEFIKSTESLLTIHARYGAKTLPIPDEKTTVVAVLGSSMLSEDDWLASDCCHLHGALGGTAKKEVWLASETLPEYSKKYLPLLPGSHVVFDDTVKAFTTFVRRNDLGRSFLDYLEDASVNTASGDNILVVILAHEHEESGDLEIGNSFVSRDAVELAFAGTEDGVEITIVVTSCFSGIWAVPFENPKSTVLAATTRETPSYAFAASGYCRGGPITQAVAEGFSKLVRNGVDSSDDSESWTYLFASSVDRTISIEDFCSKIPHSKHGEYFEPYANRVIDSAKRLQWLPAKMTPIEVVASEEVLGGRHALSSLFRVVSLLELPKEANFSCIPLAVGEFTSHRRTAGIKLGPWAARAQVLYEVRAGRSPGPDNRADNIPISRHAAPVAKGILPEEKCKELAQRIQVRIRSDEEAQRIVDKLGRMFGKNLTQIIDWSWEDQYRKCPDSDSDRKYQSVMTTYPRSDRRHSKPLAYIPWAAAECNASVDQLAFAVGRGLYPQ